MTLPKLISLHKMYKTEK